MDAADYTCSETLKHVHREIGYSCLRSMIIYDARHFGNWKLVSLGTTAGHDRLVSQALLGWHRWLCYRILQYYTSNSTSTLREVQHPNIDTTTAFSLSYSTARTASGLDNQHVRVPDPRASAVVRWMRTLRTWLRHTGQYTFHLRRRHWADLAAIRSEPSAYWGLLDIYQTRLPSVAGPWATHSTSSLQVLSLAKSRWARDSAMMMSFWQTWSAWVIALIALFPSRGRRIRLTTKHLTWTASTDHSAFTCRAN